MQCARPESTPGTQSALNCHGKTAIALHIKRYVPAAEAISLAFLFDSQVRNPYARVFAVPLSTVFQSFSKTVFETPS